MSGETAPQPGSPEGWAQVAETKQRYEAELMALRLQESGIEVHVLDQSYNQEPMPDVRGLALVRVLVPAGRAEEAGRLLAAPVDLPEDGEAAEDADDGE